MDAWDLGQVAPPAHLGGYSLVAALAPSASVGAAVDKVDFPGGRQAVFDGMLELMRVGQGWEKWSHGYGGDVLYWDELLLGRSTVRLALPAGTRVFSLFLEPNFFGPASFRVTASNGAESIFLDGWSVEGEGGARGLAFGVRAGAPDLVSVTFSGLNPDPDGFGFGELALNGAPHVPSVSERTETLGLLLGVITAGLPSVGCVPTVVSNTARYFYTQKAASECFGRNQLQVYVADTGSGLVAGPYATEWMVYIRTVMANINARVKLTH